MNPTSVITIAVALFTVAVVVSCGQEAPTAPAPPDTPLPAPTTTPPTSTTIPAIQTPAPAFSRMRAAPTATPQTVFVPTFISPTATPEATADPSQPRATATQEPTQKPELVLTYTPEPLPTDTPIPTQTREPEPTETPVPTLTQEPTPQSPLQVIVVDFYAGNTYRDPGDENCNPQRCGGAMIQFSRPVLVQGEIFLDVAGKGIMWCIQGCSPTEPSPYMIFTGAAWVEPGDTIYDDRIIGNGVAKITDEHGLELDSYGFGYEVTARPSDFAMVERPTPAPTPIPSAVSNLEPYVRDIEYIGEVVRLHLSEPVYTHMHDESDIAVHVRLAGDETVRGMCVTPCDGTDAELSFQVPGLDPDAIASSFYIADGASVLDAEGLSIDQDFEEITLTHRPSVNFTRASATHSGVWYAKGEIQVGFSGDVRIDTLDVYAVSHTGVIIPCKVCPYGPKDLATLLIFGWTADNEDEAPVLYEGDTIDYIIVNGRITGTNGLAATVDFDPIPLDPYH